MPTEASNLVFKQLIIAVVRRVFAQNERTMPAPAELERLADRLALLVVERGLPAPLAPGERGAPGNLPSDQLGACVDRLCDRTSDPLLVDAARQLVKACFYPEFTVCRDSFREVKRDGSCRRQENARLRGRVSGAHCVDCPHWVALPRTAHEAFLAANWLAGAEDFRRQRDVALPEDFRALRLWLFHAARAAGSQAAPPPA